MIRSQKIWLVVWVTLRLELWLMLSDRELAENQRDMTLDRSKETKNP